MVIVSAHLCSFALETGRMTSLHSQGELFGPPRSFAISSEEGLNSDRSFTAQHRQETRHSILWRWHIPLLGLLLMSYQIQPHQIILAGMVTRSTEGANSHFNTPQEYVHSCRTHFADVIIWKGHLSAKEWHKAFVAFSTRACPAHFYMQTSYFLKTKDWSSDKYLFGTHLLKMLGLLPKHETQEKRRNKSQELVSWSPRKAKTHETTVALSKCLWMLILATAKLYSTNNRNKEKHARSQQIKRTPPN